MATVGASSPQKPKAYTPATRSSFDDSKILGQNTLRKKEKITSSAKFQTRNFRNINSCWTPVIHKPSNEQIYKERRDLVCHWFDMWSESQRKRMLDLLFRRCSRSQLYFVQHWFDDHVPLFHTDFTRLFPRILTLKIFSYLDPKSLSKAAQVSWNWKFLTEQDTVWKPKCARLGWFLPYEPDSNEYGAWKRHYIACTQTLDYQVPSKYISKLYGQRSDQVIKTKTKKKHVLDQDLADQVMSARPPWKDNDYFPTDLDKAQSALLKEYNPNDPNLPPALTLAHDNFGIPKKFVTIKPFGLESTKRMKTHRFSADDEVSGDSGNQLLSRSLNLERSEELRLLTLINQPWEPPPASNKPPFKQLPSLQGGPPYALSWKHQQKQPMSKSYLHQANPRVIFISSRVPAADLLVDAVLFGVIPIVYEYEGTTLQSLKNQLDSCLQGRNAQSIGLFCHHTLPGELCLVQDSKVTINNLASPEIIEFFETVASHVLPRQQNGHVDVFSPLGTSEFGLEILTQLRILTGLDFAAPASILGRHAHVIGDWTSDPEDAPPPKHYFCTSKLSVWANTAEQAQEACGKVRAVLGPYFEQKHKDVVAQLVGQCVFDALGSGDIQNINLIGRALTRGLESYAEHGYDDDPVQYLGEFLLKARETSSRRRKPKPVGIRTLSQEVERSDNLELSERYESDEQSERLEAQYTEDFEQDDSEGNINNHNRQKGGYTHNHTRGFTDDSGLTEEDEDEGNTNNNHGGYADEDDGNTNNNHNGDGDTAEKNPRVGDGGDGDHSHEGSLEFKDQDDAHSRDGSLEFAGAQGDDDHSHEGSLEFKDPGPRSLEFRDETTQRVRREPRVSYSDSLLTSHWGTGTGTRLLAEDIAAMPDRRSMIAHEVLSSEGQYLLTLSAIRNVFFTPLKNALASNRAILSAHNVQIIFADIVTLHGISQSLVEDLEARFSTWGPRQCLADIFVRLTGKLKAYVNFLNNYPTILATIDRCTEQVPNFRAFLRRYERTAEAKMLSLPELYLAPVQHIPDYVKLLSWYQVYTPKDHADRNDLDLALRSLTELAQLVEDCQERSACERTLVRLQKMIRHCPTLLEANRFFIKQHDFAHLRAPVETLSPELRVYQHFEMLGLFLFNDALVVTRRVTRHVPYERTQELVYTFDVCTGLSRLRLRDIPNSKYVQHAFQLYTPRYSWVCKADTEEDKLNWMNLVEKTVSSALDE